MAQLVEVRRSNPVISKLLHWTFICFLSTVLKRQKYKKKRPGMANLKNFQKQLIFVRHLYTRNIRKSELVVRLFSLVSNCQEGCRHSSVDLSAPAILPPRIQVPSTPSILFSFIVFVLYLSREKNENKLKEARFGPFKITIVKNI